MTEAFIGPRPKGKEVRHLDGNGKNNALSNLEYGSSYQNKIDNTLHGKYKLKPVDILFIKKSNLKAKELSEMFKVGIRHIFSIRSDKRCWSHVN